MNPLGTAASMAPARAESFRVDGLALTRRVRPDADPSLPLVVLVHGAMDRAASFARVMRRLPGLEVVAYDRRGYGESVRLDRLRGRNNGASANADSPGSVASHGRDLLTVVEHCIDHSPLDRRNPRVVVVGHSLGGLISLWVGCRHPDWLGCVGAYESPAPWLDGSFEKVGGGAVDVAASKGNSSGAEYFYRMMIGEETFARLRASDIEARRAEGDALIAELESLRDPGQAFDLGSISVPVVVGVGEVSSPSMKKNADLIDSAIPHALRVTVRGAAHGAHLTKPEGYAGYVRVCVERSSEARND